MSVKAYVKVRGNMVEMVDAEEACKVEVEVSVTELWLRQAQRQVRSMDLLTCPEVKARSLCLH